LRGVLEMLCGMIELDSVAGGDAFFGGGARCPIKRFPNWMTLHQMEIEQIKRNAAGAMSATRS